MFHSARIKLTVWYLLIIMLISISFSVAMYNIIASELNRVELAQRLRIERGLPERPRLFPQRPFSIDPDLVEDTKNRLVLILAAVNFAILGASAAAGYFLAGKTLKPIAEMVDEQNRFITDASHEIRTPLTSLKSEIEVNLRDKSLNLTDAKKLLTSNLEEVNNLQVLSDSLIRLTKYQRKNNNNQAAKISFKKVIDEAMRKVARLAKNKNIKIVGKVANYDVFGNQQLLTEMFVIFLDNAVKYSSKNTKVYLTAKKTDGHLLVSIEDQGMGITEKELPHLFNRFFRGDKSRNKMAVAGYGLGLSIAKQIISEHHGSIDVKSKVNKGTTFTIKLPAKR